MLDCYDKTLVFQTDYVPDQNKETSSFISANKVIASLRGGAQGYLLPSFLEVKEKENVDITLLPIVREFSKVFPEDVPGLPPEREIELSIDLIPGTGPISIAPYRMSPVELAELKKQMEDVLTKQFIRPSVSLWGAPALLVKKKDGGSRPCVDYRQLNKARHRRGADEQAAVLGGAFGNLEADRRGY